MLVLQCMSLSSILNDAFLYVLADLLNVVTFVLSRLPIEVE